MATETPAAPAAQVAAPTETPATPAAPVPTPADKPAETPPAEGGQPAQPTESERIATMAAKLARQRARWESERRADQQKRTQLEADAQWAQQLREKVKQNPLELLQQVGVDYDQLTEAVLREGRAPTLEEKLAQLEDWKTKREADEKATQDRATQERQVRAEQQSVALVRGELEAGGEAFQLINVMGRHDDVLAATRQYITEHAKAGRFDTESLSEAEAKKILRSVAAAYEKELEEEFGGLLSKATKLTARIASPRTDQAQNGQANAAGARGNSSVNLTSRNTTEAPPPTATRALSREESIRLAWERAQAKVATRRQA